MSLIVTHVGFSDESSWNTGRFRGLGLVTVPLDALDQLEGELQRLLEESGVHEFRWKELDGAKERFAAQKMIAFAIDKACARKLRIDVLIWDIQDSRHNVPGRDDIANLQRMYYHLFRNVLLKRWPDDAVWRLHPDEHTAMDWDTVQDYLEKVADRFEVELLSFAQGQFRFSLRLRREFRLEEIRPVSSHKHPMLQLADLFTGMAVFSWNQFAAYKAWLENREDTADLSRSSRERFLVLRYFDEYCKRRKLGVSLKTKGGLWTPKPENPLNFWKYEPQHSEDKAPTRKQA